LKYARAHIFVEGDVNDISFNYFAKEKSNHLNLKGWVKSLPSGEVEVMFEGEEERIHEMVEWCKKGPSIFRNNTVRVEFSDFVGEFEEFEIRR
jgi:acylphosphatase